MSYNHEYHQLRRLYNRICDECHRLKEENSRLKLEIELLEGVIEDKDPGFFERQMQMLMNKESSN